MTVCKSQRSDEVAVPEISDEALAEAVGSAEQQAEPRGGIHAVDATLRSLADEPDDPLRGIVAAMDYHLSFDAEARERHGPFGPMMEFDGKAYPAPLSAIADLDPGIFRLWERALGVAQLPAVRARLADLLWEARHGARPDLHAREAIDEYAHAIDDDLQHPVDIGDGIRRAMEIASQLNDAALRTSTVEAAVRLVRASIDADEPMPGVVLRLLEQLASDRPNRRPDDLAELLGLAFDRYGSDPWHLESLATIMSPLADEDDRDALWARAADAFAALAASSTGIARQAHLHHALEIAEQHRLPEVAVSLRRDIEQMSDDDLELKSISAEVNVPAERVEAFVSQFVGDDRVAAALARFGSYLINANTDELRRRVGQRMTDHPIQFLVTRVIIGPENTVARSPAAGDNAAEQELIREEAMGLSIFAHFAVDILDRVRDRYGSVADAVSFFENEFISTDLAAAFARGARLYELDEFDAAASVLAPRLETAVRRLAGTVGLPVTRSIDPQGRASQVKGLGQLLTELEGALPETTRRHMRVLLTDPLGLNLRNTVAHGLAPAHGQPEAALLLHAACHLSILMTDDAAAGT